MLAAFLTYCGSCVVFDPPAGWPGLVQTEISDLQECEQKFTKPLEAP